MNAAEREAKLSAYRDALDIVRHHAQLCSEAASLEMDIRETLERRVAELEAQAAAAPAKRGKDKGHG